MLKTHRRLLVAAGISFAGFIATFAWYYFTDASQFGYGKAKPIAKLGFAINDVHRKPVKRLIWQPVVTDDALYSGEAIRTAFDAEAVVQFIEPTTGKDIGTRIELDPDSVVVLEEANGRLQLDFRSGHMYVAGGAPGMMLTAGERKLTVGATELVLGRNAEGGFDVDVLAGDDSLATSRNRIVVTSPRYDSSVYVTPSEKTAAIISFSALPPGYTPRLEVGKARDGLTVAQGLHFKPGEVSYPFPVGRHLWRLVATSSDPAKPELRSAIYKLNVLPKMPATPLSPAESEIVDIYDEYQKVEFTWLNPAQLENMALEVFSGGDTTTTVLSKPIEKGVSLELAFADKGEFQWRLRGMLKGTREELISELIKFKVVSHDGTPAPLLVSPKEGASFAFQEAEAKGIDFGWKPVRGATKYKLKLIDPATQAATEHELTSTKLNLKDMKPGTYTWTVSAFSTKGAESKPAAPMGFELQKIEEMKWADGKSSAVHHYLSAKPRLDLRWENGPASATKWRSRVWSERTPASEVWQALSAPRVSLPLEADGIYFAEVEALDAENHVVARTSRRRIELAMLPLLSAPAFDPSLGERITALNNGAARIVWLEVEGAAQYVMELKGASQINPTETKVKGLTTTVRRLMPGRYEVTLRSVDKFGRRGPASEAKTLVVPDLNDLLAPKLKEFKVQ